MRIGLGINFSGMQSAGGLSLAVIARATDGTTATLRITGTLSAAFPARGSDGTTATVRIN